MIGRMLQFLYHGDYDVLNIAADITRLLDAASPSTLFFDTMMLAQDFDFEIQAAMYAIGDHFEIPNLKSASQALFVAELRSKEFRLADLVAAVKLVYTTTSENDYGLRKWVVYRAQQLEGELVRYDEFKALLKERPDFAWDLATKYAKANFLWCPDCECIINLVQCRCGFAGMCGDSICTTGEVKSLRCTCCDSEGILQREIPQLDGSFELGVLGRTDQPHARTRKAPKKKSRAG